MHNIFYIMNPIQAQLLDEERLEHYIKDILPLELKAQNVRHIPNALEVETFDRAEAHFIKDYFGGSQSDYNEWKKENRRFIYGA